MKIEIEWGQNGASSLDMMGYTVANNMIWRWRYLKMGQPQNGNFSCGK
jgi:hypothetical protein